MGLGALRAHMARACPCAYRALPMVRLYACAIGLGLMLPLWWRIVAWGFFGALPVGLACTF